MLSSQDINVISQICNHTWGDSTTKISPTAAIKARIVSEDTLQIEFYTIFKVISDRHLIEQQEAIRKEAVDTLNQLLKKIKDDFKKITKKTLKVTQKSIDDSIEMVSVQRHVSLNATVKFVLKGRFEVSA